MNPLPVNALQALLDSGVECAVLDVREQGEAHRGHVPGCTFLPRRQIETRLPALVVRPSTPVVLIDEGGNDQRACRAQHTLQRMGYQNAALLDGGMAAWRAAGKPVATGSNVPSKLFGEQVQHVEQVPHLDVATLRRWQDEGRPHLVLDIRSPEEYRRNRIPGARGAFGTDLALLAQQLKRHGQAILVHCSGRTRSIIACRTLQLLGVENVFALENGTMGWRLAGFELERGEGAGMLAPDPADLARNRAAALALAGGAGARPLSAAQLESLWTQRRERKANLGLIDVRQLPEYVQGHLPGAMAVPGGLAIQRADEFVAVRNELIVFVDDNEARAALAAYWYRRMGFRRVHWLAGGIPAWQAAGLPLEQGRGRDAVAGLEEARSLVQLVSPAQLQALPAPLLVNVDASPQARKARLPGSTWVRYGELEQWGATLPAGDRERVVLTCRDGRLSTLAGANLAREGWSRPKVLAGGVTSWQEAGQAIESGAAETLAGANDVVVQPYDAGLEEMRRYLEWEQKLT